MTNKTIDDTVSNASLAKLTAHPGSFANKPRNEANLINKEVYETLKADFGEYFLHDNDGNYKRIEGSEGSKLQKTIKDKIIDSKFAKYKSSHNLESLDRETYVRDLMSSDLGMSDAELNQMVQSLNSLEETHFKSVVSDPLGQRALQAEIQILIQNLQKIKDDATSKGSYVDGVKFLQDELDRYAKNVDYQGPKQEIRDVQDAQTQFNTIFTSAVGVEQQKKVSSGYTAPRYKDVA